MVQSSLKEVTDTLVQVTGSKGDLGPVQEKSVEPVYRCERCKNVVEPTWKVCPNCGLVFKAGLKPAPEPQPVTEVLEPSPPIPPEIKGKIGYLRRLAVMIKQKHDPVAKGRALFKVADPEEKLMLLFTAEFGYANLMRLAQPYKNSPEIPEGEVIFQIIESGNGRLWISNLFKSIRDTAKEDAVSLSPPLRQKFLEQLNAYSPVKFNMRPGAKTTLQGEKAGPIKHEKVEQVAEESEPVKPKPKKKGEDPMTTCPVCDEPMPVSKLKEHLFTVHPKQPKPPTVQVSPEVRKPKLAPLSTLTEETAWSDEDEAGLG